MSNSVLWGFLFFVPTETIHYLSRVFVLWQRSTAVSALLCGFVGKPEFVNMNRRARDEKFFGAEESPHKVGDSNSYNSLRRGILSEKANLIGGIRKNNITKKYHRPL